MIDIKDRVPTRPNRIKLTNETTGEVQHFIWERADEPTEQGTPINRALFESIKSVIINKTLISTSWSGSTAPFVQEVTVEGYSTDKKVLFPTPTSKSDMDEYVRCGIRFEDFNGETVRALCYLAKPTKDISVTMELKDKQQ